MFVVRNINYLAVVNLHFEKDVIGNNLKLIKKKTDFYVKLFIFGVLGIIKVGKSGHIIISKNVILEMFKNYLIMKVTYFTERHTFLRN